jgi:hypothetical protein
VVKVAQREGKDPVPTEVIAEAIIAISEGVKKLRAGKLNDKALVLLIQHAAPTVPGKRGYSKAPLSAKTIKAVLDGMEGLQEQYLKKKPKG